MFIRNTLVTTDWWSFSGVLGDTHTALYHRKLYVNIILSLHWLLLEESQTLAFSYLM